MDAYRFEINPPGAELSTCNAVLVGKVASRPYIVDQYQTTLSIKSVTPRLGPCTAQDRDVTSLRKETSSS